MKIELIELTQLSGYKAHFYTIRINDEDDTLYAKFAKKYIADYPDEIKEMMTRMYIMGHSLGAKEHFFKMSEGSRTDNVVALFDRPDKHLRLYCLRFGNATVILGGGGPKRTRTYQEDSVLYSNVLQLQKVSKLIYEAIINKELVIDDDGNIICEQTIDDYEDD